MRIGSVMLDVAPSGDLDPSAEPTTHQPGGVRTHVEPAPPRQRPPTAYLCTQVLSQKVVVLWLFAMAVVQDSGR